MLIFVVKCYIFAAIKLHETVAVQKNPIKEAERYMANAKQILTEKAGKEGSYYSDPKYVKLAGHAAWSGVLVALDAVTDVRKNAKKGARVDIKDYQNAIAKKDKKMTIPLQVAYNTLHLSLGYDGNLSFGVVQDGLKQGKMMIDWASKHYEA